MIESQEQFSRQILAFGIEGQKAIMNTKVGIVGLGGMGSCVVQMLSYLGTQEFVLVDDDRVEESNLNRLVGAVREDIVNKTLKVEVAQRVIRSINPKANITMLGNLRSEEVLERLAIFPDVIFGCVDNDSTRMILTDLAAAYRKILIDCATEIEPDGDKVKNFGGRVVIARPGDFCLWCANQIDARVAKEELETDREKSFRQHHGYGLGALIVAPAVISLNMTIAGLAVTEFLMLITGIREPERKLTYKGMTRGKVVPSNDFKKPGCFVCESLVGKADKVDLKRYLRSSLPADLPK
ncbi:MAG: ThiF family adenylyltransferase [Candidatus Omnitrophica bacterium]|nr:ThiF family adenylyltransferase [Candidatus Omnitrophota bacterium]